MPQPVLQYSRIDVFNDNTLTGGNVDTAKNNPNTEKDSATDSMSLERAELREKQRNVGQNQEQKRKIHKILVIELPKKLAIGLRGLLFIRFFVTMLSSYQAEGAISSVG